jgi:hypothetical protein
MYVEFKYHPTLGASVPCNFSLALLLTYKIGLEKDMSNTKQTMKHYYLWYCKHFRLGRSHHVQYVDIYQGYLTPSLNVIFELCVECMCTKFIQLRKYFSRLLFKIQEKLPHIWAINCLKRSLQDRLLSISPITSMP